jgi:HAD superfamily hydrolase (TIGR01490 family)
MEERRVTKPRCAFFDLDHTLTHTDTSFAFLCWWARRHPFAYLRLCAALFIIALWKLGICGLPRVKEFCFAMLRGRTATELDTAARAFADTSFDRLVKKEAVLYIRELAPEYRLVLASASPEFYVRYFAEKFGFEVCVATRYVFEAGVFTGRIEGKDCRGEEKVRRIAECLPLESYDRQNSLAFSDNLKADKPLLALAQNAFRVDPSTWHPEPLAPQT